MKAVLQRVTSASVRVDGEAVGAIDTGLLILLGVRKGDTEEDARLLAERCSVLRVFSDNDKKMNLSLRDVSGNALVVSQFTLYGDARKGTRPSYSDAAGAETARNLYERFCAHLEGCLGPGKVQTGIFGARMEVELVNDGPVTLVVESRR